MANIGDLYYDKVKNHPMGEIFFPEFFDNPNFDNMLDFFNIGVIEQVFLLLYLEQYLAIVIFSLA